MSIRDEIGRNKPMTYEKFVELNKEVRRFLRDRGMDRKVRILRVSSLEYLDVGGDIKAYDSKIYIEVSVHGKTARPKYHVVMETLVDNMKWNNYYITNPSALRYWPGWKYRKNDLYGVKEE